MDPLARLALAALAFFALHSLVSGTAIRAVLVRAVGERGFRAGFSIASLAAIVWLVLSYRNSPCAPLWVLPREFSWLPALLMPLSLFFVAGAFSVPNPTAVGGERALTAAEPARGALRITRHPFLWGVMLWASLHLLVIGGTAALWFFGSFLLTAALGTRSIDRKRARSGGEAWSRFLAVTSNLPFAAIASGRNRLVLRELALPLAIAAALYVVLLVSHQWLFGVSPIPR
ncbi:MAG: NnrU family protein [Myxococcota bacterium]